MSIKRVYRLYDSVSVAYTSSPSRGIEINAPRSTATNRAGRAYSHVNSRLPNHEDLFTHDEEG